MDDEQIRELFGDRVFVDDYGVKDPKIHFKADDDVIKFIVDFCWYGSGDPKYVDPMTEYAKSPEQIEYLIGKFLYPDEDGMISIGEKDQEFINCLIMQEFLSAMVDKGMIQMCWSEEKQEIVYAAV